MKKLALSLSMLLPLVIWAQISDESWAIGFGGPENDHISAIESFSNSSIAVAGKYSDTLTIGDTTIIGEPGYNCFLAIFDSLSNCKHLQTIQEFSGINHIHDLACDNLGNLYMVGIKSNYMKRFIRKYNSDGDLLLAKDLTGTNVECKQIFCDSENNVYLFGKSKDGLSFGSNSFSFDEYRTFLLKISPTFEVINFSLIYEQGYFPEQICISNNDEIYLTLQPAIGGVDIRFLKINSEGEVLWDKLIKPLNYSWGNIGCYSTALCANENGVIMAGRMDCQTNFSEDTIVDVSFYFDIFLAKYNSNGTFEWIHSDNTMGNNGMVNSMFLQEDGSILTTGSFQDNAIIGDSIYNVCPLGCDYDIFIAEFNNEGNLSFFKQGGGTGNPCDTSEEIIIDDYNNIYNIGTFGGIGYFGLDTIYSDSWYRDCYLLKFNPVDEWLITSMPETYFISQPKVEIFPNPATKELTFLCENGFNVDEISIYNSKGQKVLHEYLTSDKIDISRLGKGIHVLEIMTHKTMIRKKLIIR